MPYASLTKSFARYDGSDPRFSIDGDEDLPLLTLNQYISFHKLPCKHRIILFAENPDTFRTPTLTLLRHSASSTLHQTGE